MSPDLKINHVQESTWFKGLLTHTEAELGKS